MATISNVDYALFAGAAYFDTRAQLNLFPIPYGWYRVSRFPEASSGFEASAFGNAATLATSTEIVIAFGGTNPNSIFDPDNAANIELAIGYGHSQLQQAADYYLQIKAANPNATITLTGHSLGGGLAALIGVFFSVPATTFDPAPFANSAQDPSVLASLNPLNILTPDVAANLKQYLQSETFTTDTPAVAATKTAARDAMVQQLDSFLTLRQANGGIPNSSLIDIYRVDGEFVSSLPIGLYDPIGNTAKVITHGPHFEPSN